MALNKYHDVMSSGATCSCLIFINLSASTPVMGVKGEGQTLWYDDWRLHCAAIIFIVFLAYSGALANGFEWDDFDFVVELDATRTLTSIPSFFAGANPHTHQVVYRPVRNTLYAISYQLFGTDTYA